MALGNPTSPPAADDSTFTHEFIRGITESRYFFQVEQDLKDGEKQKQYGSNFYNKRQFAYRSVLPNRSGRTPTGSFRPERFTQVLLSGETEPETPENNKLHSLTAWQ